MLTNNIKKEPSKDSYVPVYQLIQLNTVYMNKSKVLAYFGKVVEYNNNKYRLYPEESIRGCQGCDLQHVQHCPMKIVQNCCQGFILKKC